jgi:hypothetical protein
MERTKTEILGFIFYSFISGLNFTLCCLFLKTRSEVGKRVSSPFIFRSTKRNDAHQETDLGRKMKRVMYDRHMWCSVSVTRFLDLKHRRPGVVIMLQGSGWQNVTAMPVQHSIRYTYESVLYDFGIVSET